MTAPLLAKQTNYLKNNVPYYKYYQTTDNPSDSQALFSGATATVGGVDCYANAYSFKSTGPSSGSFPSSGAGMATPIITPTTQNNKNTTLSMWIKPSSNNLQSKTIWGCHADITASGISFGMDDANAGKLKFHAKGYGGVLRSNTTLTSGNWYFIVCVYDRTNMQLRIYINGTLDNSKSMTSSADYDATFGRYIWKAGFWSNNGYTSPTASQNCKQAFPGNMLNACVWYRALSQSEITTLYNNGKGMTINTSVAPYTDVAIAYPLNETSGTVAYSAITGQASGTYGSNTSYNLHVNESIFPGTGVQPEYLYTTGGNNWETDLQVSSGDAFSSTLTLTKSIFPTKVTVVFDNTTPKNPVDLTFEGSNDMSTWTTLTTISVPSNTNQTIEQNITSANEYKYFRTSTEDAYLTTGLTINNITYTGYWKQRAQVGQHEQWNERVQEGTHTIVGTSSDYDTVEYQNKEYEVQNV